MLHNFDHTSLTLLRAIISYPKYVINEHLRHIPVLKKYSLLMSIATDSCVPHCSCFSSIFFCTATFSRSRIPLSLSLLFLHQPPSVSPPLLQQLNGQWQLLRASLVCYSGREVQRRGQSQRQLPSCQVPRHGEESSPLPSTTSSELQTVGQASSWLMRMCRKVDFIHIGPRAGEKHCWGRHRATKHHLEMQWKSCLTNLKSIPVYYLYLALTLPNARIYLSWSFNF